ncbi:MAG: tyrosine--tRNA ligase [Sandaracinaceae bacterium]
MASVTVAPAREQLDVLRAGVIDLQREEELLAKLEEGRPLLVKAGFDPTRPDLHLGHTVLMDKMRQFQDFGHRVVFVVGNFTASIGDPTGRSQTRPALDEQEIEEGARTYAEQAFLILDRERTHLVYNRDWLGRLTFADVIRLAGRYTLARMMERDDFKTRWAEQRAISIHELLYPLAQAYDSVHLRADVELGGTDQLFNLLVGRELMRDYGMSPQVIMTTPLLEGINARTENGRIVGDKMSKSLDNYVAVTERASEQFGKLMSISDDLMYRYMELLTPRTADDVAREVRAVRDGRAHPKDQKLALAAEIVERFHGRDAALKAHEAWEAQFSRREVPGDMPVVELQSAGPLPLPRLLADAGLVKSTSEARRRIEQGAVKIDDERIDDVHFAVAADGVQRIVRAGKRAWAAVTVLEGQ